nr:hypothetical protein [uncultured bacterium]
MILITHKSIVTTFSFYFFTINIYHLNMIVLHDMYFITYVMHVYYTCTTIG